MVVAVAGHTQKISLHCTTLNSHKTSHASIAHNLHCLRRPLRHTTHSFHLRIGRRKLWKAPSWTGSTGPPGTRTPAGASAPRYDPTQ